MKCIITKRGPHLPLIHLNSLWMLHAIVNTDRWMQEPAGDSLSDSAYDQGMFSGMGGRFICWTNFIIEVDIRWLG